MFSSEWEPGSGKRLLRVSGGPYRTPANDTPLHWEVSRFPLPSASRLTWPQFMALSLAPLAFGLVAYALAMLA